MAQQQGSYLMTLRVIFFAFLMSQITLGLFMIAFNQMGGLSEGLPPTEISSVFRIIVPVFALSAIFGSQYLFNAKLRSINKGKSLAEKLTEYRTAFLLKIAFIEGAAMLSLVVYFLTNYWLFIAIGGILAGVFVMYYPSAERIAQHLELLPAEKEKISQGYQLPVR
jgi:hypothetical protein